jgi:DNA-binding beta-propeller fold protein YncE
MGTNSYAGLLALSLLVTACGDRNEAQDEPRTCSDSSTLCTYAGNGEAGFDGDGNPLLESSFYWPVDVTVTQTGETYVIDWNNHAIRVVEADNTFRTVIGTGFVGDGPEDLSDLQAPGAVGTTVDLNHPTQLVELPDGKLLLVAWHNHKLRQYDPETGLVLVTCGSGAGFSGDGQVAHTAKLNQPTQVLLGDAGDQFILDMRNQVVRRIDAEGLIDTVAGTPEAAGYAGDGGPPSAALFRFPAGSNPPPGGALALDPEGRLYVSDTLNHVIRRIDFEADVIETVAGNGEAGFSGDGEDATSAQLNNPRDLEISPDGQRLYIADELNHRIRVLDLESGVIDTVAGNGDGGYDGEAMAPTEAALFRPAGLEFDNDGLLYIADTYNHRVRRFDPEAAR